MSAKTARRLIRFCDFMNMVDSELSIVANQMILAVPTAMLFGAIVFLVMIGG